MFWNLKNIIILICIFILLGGVGAYILFSPEVFFSDLIPGNLFGVISTQVEGKYEKPEASNIDNFGEKVITWKVISKSYIGEHVDLKVIRIDNKTHVFHYELNETLLDEIQQCKDSVCLLKVRAKWFPDVLEQKFLIDMQQIDKYPIKNKSLGVLTSVNNFNLKEKGSFIVNSSGQIGETLTFGFGTVYTETVESAGVVGKYSSIAIDSNNKVHISHLDDTNNELRYCNNTAGSWSCTNADVTIDDGGFYTSIAIDSNDKVHIIHMNTSNELRYCNNTAGSWSCVKADTTDGSAWTSIAIDSNDKIHISYLDYSGVNDLKYCNNTAGSWSCIALDTVDVTGAYSSIAIDSNDKIHISYMYGTGDDLRYCNNTAGSWSYTTIDNRAIEGLYTSIAIDSKDKIHISHHYHTGSDLRYCNNTAGSWSCTNADTANSVGEFSSIAIDSKDKVHISYYDVTYDDLRICNNTAGSWSCAKVADADALYLGYPNGRGLAIKKPRLSDFPGSFSGDGHISWYTGGDLKYSNYTIEEVTEDTCTCVGLNNNWEVDMSDYCELDDDCNLGTGKLSFTGSGYANCSAKINTTNLGDPGSTGILYVSDGCLIYVS